MENTINVSRIDQIIRLLLGFTDLALIIYHFFIEELFTVYALIPLIILIPFFLKTGITRYCPIMAKFTHKPS